MLTLWVGLLWWVRSWQFCTCWRRKVQDGCFCTPLNYACETGNLQLVKHLLQSHPHLLQGTLSPLFSACEKEQLEVLQYFVEVEGRDYKSVVDPLGNALVHYAARSIFFITWSITSLAITQEGICLGIRLFIQQLPKTEWKWLNSCLRCLLIVSLLRTIRDRLLYRLRWSVAVIALLCTW